MAAPLASAGSAAALAARPVAILLVDDEEKNLLALESILDAPGYELVRAQSANEALLALMDREYAAIVLDVQMPETDGIELARLIKQRKKTQHIPILFLTAYYQADEQIVQGYGAGAVDYLTKPVNPDVLRSKIGVFLDLFEKTRALGEANRALSGQIAEREKAEAAVRSAYAELEAKNAELENQAEERARRIRAEVAQAEAEAARERSALLAEASRLFATSFDPEVMLAAFAKLIVPKLADCCIVDTVSDDGLIQPTVVVHVDPEKERMLREMRDRFPSRLDDSSRMANILRAGSPIVCRELGESEIELLARSPEEAAAVRALGHGSFIGVPLRARDRTLGCLYLGDDDACAYRDADINLAEALAERAAVALDNARLFTEAGQARAAAEAANAAKDRFLAMLSHELRTPLSPVLHAVALLDEEPAVPPPVRELLTTIHRNVQLEARLIDDLLDLARIRNGKLQLHLEPVDAHELLRQALEICRSEIEARTLRLELHLGARHSRLLADSARLQQIFWNLVTNAIKFTPPGGLITLRTEDGPEGLRVEVSDTGCGIAAERLQKIFDAFEQEERQRTSGLGLGLAICKALAELHRGTISARSAGWGEGSSFIVQLPVVADVPATPAEPADASPLPPVRLRVLLVEDHHDTASMLQRLLARRGHEVRSADTVASALTAARDFEFDVLLSDIGLPDGTGVELMEQIVRESAGRRPFRGIALSGFGMHEDLERSRTAGFAEHLTKPVDFSLLERTLARLALELTL